MIRTAPHRLVKLGTSLNERMHASFFARSCLQMASRKESKVIGQNCSQAPISRDGGTASAQLQY